MTTTHLPLLGVGDVIHQRLSPAKHGFRYGVFFLMLPMRCKATVSAWKSRWWLARNRFGLLSFYDADHGNAELKGLVWIESLLKSEGIHDADGDIWLQCFPRVLGYAFKPVSFWFCHRSDGALRCVVVEVNNTFGERHAYLLDEKRPLNWGETLHASKAFHVSPFCAVEGAYRFRFMRTRTSHAHEEERLVLRIDYDAPATNSDSADTRNVPLLQTSVSGKLAPARFSRVLRAFITHPLMTVAVIARIHWQALKLWLKRVPFHRKPLAPERFVSLPE